MWLVAGTAALLGNIDGQNRAFRPTVTLRDDAVLYINGTARLPGPATDNGYTFDGTTLTLNETPLPGDTVAVWQPDGPSSGGNTTMSGPTPPPGIAGGPSPTLGLLDLEPEGAVLSPPSGLATLMRP